MGKNVPTCCDPPGNIDTFSAAGDCSWKKELARVTQESCWLTQAHTTRFKMKVRDAKYAWQRQILCSIRIRSLTLSSGSWVRTDRYICGQGPGFTETGRAVRSPGRNWFCPHPGQVPSSVPARWEVQVILSTVSTLAYSQSSRRGLLFALFLPCPSLNPVKQLSNEDPNL